MNRFFKLHVGLVGYIRAEIKKKKTIQQKIFFFRDLSKQYFSFIIEEYKHLFLYLDPLYNKQKKEFAKYQQYKKDITNAWKIVQYMLTAGKNRTEMKQIRRDFERYWKITKELEEAILRDLYGQRR